LLGQRISLRSTPGRGSCFTVDLPLAAHLAPAVQAAPLPAQPLAGLRVWLIEDDTAVRDAMVARLRQWGAQVNALSSRADLELQLAGAPALPALVVSDQRLPDGTGLQCVARIREYAGRSVSALIVTGDTAPSDIAGLVSSGLPVLHKPFSGGELLSSLQDALRRTDAEVSAA
ncbi:MAG TPA: response regulator, partial [Burkholderiaceae bacterium]|nr:response regulator [Burkholderiaceae bacterium]